MQTSIRDLYLPVQPTIRQSAENVSYHEILPHHELKPFIYCYWELRTSQPLTDQFCYRVVADGCIDIYFDANDPSDSYVMGICNRHTEFMLDNSFRYIGIRFLPTMFPQLFAVPASELTNQYLQLDKVIPTIASAIASDIDPFDPITTITAKLNDLLIPFASNASNNNFDPRLYDAIDLILKNYGVLNIESDIVTGISQRQLRRLFSHYIGDSPKTFCRIVRFQNLLRAKPSTQSLRKNKLFFDVGYYDQAHFIKDFKNFYGLSPTQALE